MWGIFKGPNFFDGGAECRLVYHATRDSLKNYLIVPLTILKDFKDSCMAPEFEITEHNKDNKKRVVISSVVTGFIIEIIVALAEDNKLVIYCHSFDKHPLNKKGACRLFFLTKEIIDNVISDLDAHVDKKLSVMVLSSNFEDILSVIIDPKKWDVIKKRNFVAKSECLSTGSAFAPLAMLIIDNSENQTISLNNRFVKSFSKILNEMSKQEFGFKINSNNFEWYKSDSHYYCVKEVQDKTLIFALTLKKPGEFFEEGKLKDVFNF